MIVIGLLVVGVERVAQGRPGLGGALSTFPLFSFASLILLSGDGARDGHLTAFSSAAAVGLIHAGAALATTSLLIDDRLSLTAALLAGAASWAVAAALLAVWRP